MKILAKIAIACAMMFSVCASAYAYADDVFLCMQSEETYALSADADGFLEYVQMKDSNGAIVYPKISGDGNTYLPMRFILETAGFDDAQKNPDSQRYFKFIDADPQIDGDRQKIELFYDGKQVIHEIGVGFSYEVSEGDVRNVCIYNVNGSLFFPVRYLTGLTGAKAIFCYETGDIIFATSNVVLNDYIDENGVILDGLMQKGLYYPYLDAESELGWYKDANGDYKAINGASSNVYRIKNNLYWLDKGRVAILQHPSAEKEYITFAEEDVRVSEFGITMTKLYGIDAQSGRLFVCGLDGDDFSYLTDYAVHNLRFSNHNGRYYVFYCEDESSRIHMTEVSTEDDYLVEITDYEHNNLLNNIKTFEVTKERFTYVDTNDVTHIITLPDPLEEFEIARIPADKYKVYSEEEQVVE